MIMTLVSFSRITSFSCSSQPHKEMTTLCLNMLMSMARGRLFPAVLAPGPALMEVLSYFPAMELHPSWTLEKSSFFSIPSLFRLSMHAVLAPAKSSHRYTCCLQTGKQYLLLFYKKKARSKWYTTHSVDWETDCRLEDA